MEECSLGHGWILLGGLRHLRRKRDGAGVNEETMLLARHLEAMRALLIEKGVFTEKEYEAKYGWVTHRTDQLLAEIEDNARMKR